MTNRQAKAPSAFYEVAVDWADDSLLRANDLAQKPQSVGGSSELELRFDGLLTFRTKLIDGGLMTQQVLLKAGVGSAR